MSTTAGSASPDTSGKEPGSTEGAGRAQNGNGLQKRRRILIGISVVGAIAVCVLGYWLVFLRGIVFTDDARFAGHLVDVAPEINGRLTEVAVHEGQFVRKGTVVFRLDTSIPQAALNQSEAALVSARAGLASSEALRDKAVNGSRPEEIRAAEAVVRRLQNEEQMAQLEIDRTQKLFTDDAVSRDQFDRSRTALESARQSRETAVQNLILLQQGSRKEDVAVARAAVDLSRSKVAEAAAAVENARDNLARSTVRAPFDGWVVRRWLDPGAMPMAAQPVISMFDPSTLRIDANIEEKYLHDVAIGDTADISVDAFPDLRLHGRVTEIMRAANSEFSIIPAEGVSGTFIKVTQRVPLRIAVTVPPELALGPGLSVEVRIHSGTSAAGLGAPGRDHD
ncbi:MAG: HlyD family secretion protein [Opitutaceae bacterium]